MLMRYSRVITAHAHAELISNKLVKLSATQE